MSAAATVAAQAGQPIKDGAAPGEFVGRWKVERTIGVGTYGKVRLAIDPVNGDKVAIKVIEKAQVQSGKQVARLQREIRFLRLLHHPHIVKVYDVHETDLFIHIITEYAAGGELFDYIVAHKRVKEREARSFFRQVLSAVDYCHKNAVIHRDLKPENLLLDQSKTIKIIDFGFGNNFTVEGLLDTFCGSPYYAAPEMILGKKYEGPEVDMWSLGVILFALLCGHLPFDDDNMKELYRKIANGARHLISRLITVDPKRRATLAEVLEHKWVNDGYDGAPPNYLPVRPVLTTKDLAPDLLQKLYVFGYTPEEVAREFAPGVSQTAPSPVRATYFLVAEMNAREERRTRAGSGGNRREIEVPTLQSTTKSAPDVTMPGVALTAKARQALTGTPDRRASSPDTYQAARAPGGGSAGTGGDGTVRQPPNAKTRPVSHEPQSTRSRPPSIPLPPTPTETIGSPTMVPKDSSWFRRLSIPGSSSSHVPQPTRLVQSATSATSSRRESVSSTTGAGSPKGRLRDELRAVSGWLFNVSTTTTLPPTVILRQLSTLLTQLGVSFTVENEQSVTSRPLSDKDVISLICEADVTITHDSATQSASTITSMDSEWDGASSGSATDTHLHSPPVATAHSSHLPPPAGGYGTKQTIALQITIGRVPRMPTTTGLHFKRIHGGVWNYKKLCNRILALLNNVKS
ncbi:hypothetical protein HKX48_000584 [Thoreauomyces humboldtii]|nr:hypothetical protein HKX48_000584 [Thoreauomyces humboldtii]